MKNKRTDAESCLILAISNSHQQDMNSFLIHLIETLGCSQRNLRSILTYIVDMFQKGDKIIHNKIY